MLDGEELELDRPSMLINDRMLVPLRTISEALGCTIEWDGEKRIVAIT